MDLDNRLGKRDLFRFNYPEFFHEYVEDQAKIFKEILIKMKVALSAEFYDDFKDLMELGDGERNQTVHKEDFLDALQRIKFNFDKERIFRSFMDNFSLIIKGRGVMKIDIYEVGDYIEFLDRSVYS